MDYEIRAMGLGEILDTAFRIIRDHAALLIGISLLMNLGLRAFLVALPAATEANDTALLIAGLSFGLVLMVVSPIVGAALTHAVSAVYLSRSVTFGESLGRGLKLFLPLVGTSILMVLILIPAFIALVIPGVILTFAYMLYIQVMVVEGTAGWAALKRSMELTHGHRMRVFGVYLVALLIQMVASMALGLVTISSPYASAIAEGIVGGVMMAYMYAAFAVLYFDLRCRKEAFDLEHLAGRVTGEDRPA